MSGQRKEKNTNNWWCNPLIKFLRARKILNGKKYYVKWKYILNLRNIPLDNLIRLNGTILMEIIIGMEMKKWI